LLLTSFFSKKRATKLSDY